MRACKVASTTAFVAAVLIGCPRETNPPPDIDTGGRMSAGDGDPPPADVVHDGLGRGRLRRPQWGLLQATPIGAPEKLVGGNPAAGQVSLIVGFEGDNLLLPTDRTSTLIEDGADAGCGADHAWAYFLGADREFGSAFSFYSLAIGGESSDYQNGLVTSAPLAANTESGRVMQYVGCGSCVMFSRSPEAFEPLGDEFHTAFGASVAVGFFGDASHEARDPWWQAAKEELAIGAPMWNGGGAVHIYDPEAYRNWELAFFVDGVGGNRQCEFGSLDNPEQRWRTRTLAGGFATGEFGRSLAAADFNCDGYDDLAVGAPGADVPGGGLEPLADAGAVHVFYGGPLGIGNEGQLTITQGDFGGGGEPEVGDRFGTALAVGNFDGNRTNDFASWSCWDLAVGTPNEDAGAGEVQVFLGHTTGLSLAGVTLRAGENVVAGTRNSGDRFGYALTAGDFEFPPDGFHDLAIGAPSDEQGGSVVLVPGTNAGLHVAGASILVQGVGELGGQNEMGDDFGASLGASIEAGPARFALAIGAPGEDDDTGVVLLASLSKADGVFGVLHTRSVRIDDVSGAASPGDRFGTVLGQPRAFPQPPFMVADR